MTTASCGKCLVDYLSKFNLYCLINDGRIEEAQLIFDLKKDNPLENQMLENLYNKLNIRQKDFEDILFDNKSYTIEEVKEKLKIEIFWNDLIYLRYQNQIISYEDANGNYKVEEKRVEFLNKELKSNRPF